jgi:hypothetical protein
MRSRTKKSHLREARHVPQYQTHEFSRCADLLRVHSDSESDHVDVGFYPESDRLLRCREMTLRANRDQSASQQIWETNYLQSLSAQAALGTSSAAILPSRRANSIGLVS